MPYMTFNIPLATMQRLLSGLRDAGSGEQRSSINPRPALVPQGPLTRTLLGPSQLKWLRRELTASKSAWQLAGQQVPASYR